MRPGGRWQLAGWIAGAAWMGAFAVIGGPAGLLVGAPLALLTFLAFTRKR